MIKKRQLKILLLKKEIQDFSAPIHKDADFTKLPLKKSMDWEGKFFLMKSIPKIPSWVDFISPALESRLDEVKTQTSGAVVLIKVRNRMFALTFGYGKSLLRPDCFERNFGLRVVLNTVNPEQIRSIDMRTMEEMTLLTRRQASRVSDFGVFGLDSSQDLLQGVTGIPKDSKFASRITGAEAVTIAKEIEIEKLNQICGYLYDAYNSDNYKERFSFIDYLQLERDPGIIHGLEEQLIRDLEDKNTICMHLAPPEPEDWQNIEGFTYSKSSNAQVYLDLEISDLLHEMSPRTGFSIKYLHDKYIGVRYRESDESVMKYNAFSCLVYETELDGYLYVLSGGDWHQIEKNWSESVRRKVEDIALSDIPLPPSYQGEKEGDYNKRVAESKGWALMDKQIINLSPPYDRIEFCDLMTPEKKLIHVKRKTESSTLSHLFAQGAISAELLFRDREFREKCREKARNLGEEWQDLIPEDRPVTSDYEIIYAIVARSRPDWPKWLPFFSQLNLCNTKTRLSSFGYKISLRHVPADPV